MMRFVWLCLACVGALRGEALAIRAAVVQQYEDGPSVYRPQAFVPGETVHFSFFVDNYGRKEQQVSIHFEAQPFDPAHIPLAPPISGKIDTALAPEDKEWRPKFRGSFALPPVLLPGQYGIAIHVTDEVLKGSLDKEISFQVSGTAVEPSAALAVRDVNFFAGEEAEKPLPVPAYRVAETIHARFNVIGYRHTPEGKIDASYGIVLADAAGRVLYREPQAARDQTDSFYPKPYIPGILELNLKPGTPPGEYTLTITATDAIGDQHAEVHCAFRLE